MRRNPEDGKDRQDKRKEKQGTDVPPPMKISTLYINPPSPPPQSSMTTKTSPEMVKAPNNQEGSVYPYGERGEEGTNVAPATGKEWDSTPIQAQGNTPAGTGPTMQRVEQKQPVPHDS